MKTMNTRQFVPLAEQNMDRYLADLQAIVNIDSGTYNRAGNNMVAAYLRERFHDFGFSTSLDAQQEYGDHLVATRDGGNQKGERILLIGHIDTVFADGEAERRPFTIVERDGKRVALGPGVLDMKSGILMGMYGLQLLQATGQDTYRNVTFVCNSDEEIGSPSSKPLIQRLARQADAVIVLEPGRALGTVVSARSGSGLYRVEMRGRAAHAGVEPQKGRNAIHALSYLVQDMQALNGTIPGVTLCVTKIHGGERSNVVPDYAYCEMDVRASDRAGLKAIEAAMQQVVTRVAIEGTSATVSGSMRCMPFERSPRNTRLVQYAKEAGGELDIKIEDLGSGGASDANNTSAVGTPTIDGMGSGGGLAHNSDEYVELDYLPARIALISGLVQKISDHGMR